jgi:DNA-binding response OmpR family regulator
MVRLKAFIQGGADSRQEVQAAFSLEELQARHRALLARTEQETLPEHAGLDDEEDDADNGDQTRDHNSPDRPLYNQPQEVTGHFDDADAP